VSYFNPLAAPFNLEGSNGEGVLVVHGFGGSPAHLRMLAEHLNSSGYSVCGPLLNGHGTDLIDMESAGRSDWMASARLGFAELSKSCDRVHVFGLSMGGLLSLQLGAGFPTASLTTLNTPIKLYDRRLPFARMLRHVQRFQMWEDNDIEPVGDAARFRVQYEGVSVKAAVQLLDLIRETKAVLPQVTCPVLVIQSRVDESVRPISAEMIMSRISSFEKELLWLEHSPHNSLLYDERNAIHDRVLEHIRRS
jgi:carboxylesterase